MKYLKLTVYLLIVLTLGWSGVTEKPKESGKLEPLAFITGFKHDVLNVSLTPTTTISLEMALPVLEMMPTSTTTVEQSPRETIPLTEAKEKGLWGRPSFEGCISKYGTQSPDWLPELLMQSSWPAESWTKLCRVIGCESNFNPQAYGGLRDRQGPRMMGLLQVDRKSWTSKWQSMGFTDMFDPAQNLEFGFWIYTNTRDDENWNNWPPDQWTCDDA
jgi:Transglycosylase SLT domain